MNEEVGVATDVQEGENVKVDEGELGEPTARPRFGNFTQWPLSIHLAIGVGVLLVLGLSAVVVVEWMALRDRDEEIEVLEERISLRDLRLQHLEETADEYDEVVRKQREAEAQAAQQAADAQAAAEVAGTDTKGSGTYVVGEDMAPGQWRLEGGGNCYFELNPVGDPSDIIDNGIGPGVVFTAVVGQQVTITNCTAVFRG